MAVLGACPFSPHKDRQAKNDQLASPQRADADGFPTRTLEYQCADLTWSQKPSSPSSVAAAVPWPARPSLSAAARWQMLYSCIDPCNYLSRSRVSHLTQEDEEGMQCYIDVLAASYQILTLVSSYI